MGQWVGFPRHLLRDHLGGEARKPRLQPADVDSAPQPGQTPQLAGQAVPGGWRRRIVQPVGHAQETADQGSADHNRQRSHG